ncbi:MAG: aldo/keto reductase [Myxococcota bacterium]
MERWLTPRPPDARPLLTLGTMNFGGRTPEPEAVRIMERALELGLSTWDTANVYGDGESERIVGRAARSRRKDVRLATKVGLMRVGGKPEGLSPERIRAALDESLDRLGTDHVDLYYLHAPDYRTPLDETLSAVKEALASGKARHWGVSNFSSWQILQMRNICERTGMAPPATSQVLYNVLIRQLDVEYWKFTRQFPIHTTVYNALAGGLLTGRHRRDAPIPAGSRFDGNAMYQRRYWSERFFELVDAYGAVAREAGMSLMDLSYAWLAGAPGVDSILVGPATVEQLEAAVSGTSRVLTDDVRRRVNEMHRGFQGTDASYAR